MWNENWFVTDAELGMAAASPETDLRTVAGESALEDLKRTREAAADDQLSRRAYQTAGGKGCLMFFLSGGRAHSKATLLTLDLSDEAGFAARRLVRFFDYGLLDNSTIVRVLNELIMARRQANELEEESIRRVREALALS
jgi:hypothetical protein